MKRPVPKPDYSNAGPARDAAFLASRAIPTRALTADRATLADEATLADTAVAVDASGTRGETIDDSLLATVEDGRIKPLAMADFYAQLEARYGITPVP